MVARSPLARLPLVVCACALVAITVANPAPPKRNGNIESKMVPEKSIVIRRIPNAYFYPFSLWPLPKFPVKDKDETYEELYNSSKTKDVKVQLNKR